MPKSSATPYADLPDSAFWKTAVNARDGSDISGLWTPKFAITRDMTVVTYGSCFAQHIGRALQRNGFNWKSFETGLGNAPEADRVYNYDIFSARTGNIYTTSLLLQWIRWAGDLSALPGALWEDKARYFDPFRPTIEPFGFASAKEARRSRRVAVKSFRRSIREADVFVFTLGLTERWRDRESSVEYPLCPGTAAGAFNPDKHVFDNMDFSETHAALSQAIAAMQEMNPKLRFVLTVSPVPLTATMSGAHVIPATTYSKSVLRAVAGDIARGSEHVDYFPSYEIISAPPFKAAYFAENQRSVTPAGVERVMAEFFGAQNRAFGIEAAPAKTGISASPNPEKEADDLICEESLLAYAKDIAQ